MICGVVLGRIAIAGEHMIEGGGIYYDITDRFESTSGEYFRARIESSPINSWVIDVTSLDRSGVDGASIVNYVQPNVNDADFTVNCLLILGAGEVTVSRPSTLFLVNSAVVNPGLLRSEHPSESLIVSIDNHHLFDMFTGARVTLESILNFATGNIDLADMGTQLTLTNNLQNLGDVTVRETGGLTTLSVTNLGGFTVTGPMTMVTAAVAIVNQGNFGVSNDAVVSVSSYDKTSGQTMIADGSLGASNFGVNVVAGQFLGFGDVSSDLNVGVAGVLAPGSVLDETDRHDVAGALLLGECST